jgi:hypothetical protein
MAAVVGHATTAISCMWKPEILCTKHGFTKACNVGVTPSSPQVSHVLKCSKAIIWQTDLKVLRKGILRVAALEEKGSHILVSEAQQTWPNPQTMEEAVKQVGFFYPFGSYFFWFFVTRFLCLSFGSDILQT